MPVPVQMPLDYSMISLAEEGPHPEVVACVFPWEVFGELEGRYEEARRKYNLRETRKRKGELKRKRGRPHCCARKLLDVREYELCQCESEEPGAGGAPAFPFLSLLRCFLLAPFYECESSAEHIARELSRNHRFCEVCGFTYGEARKLPLPAPLLAYHVRGRPVGRGGENRGGAQPGGKGHLPQPLGRGRGHHPPRRFRLREKAGSRLPGLPQALLLSGARPHLR